MSRIRLIIVFIVLLGGTVASTIFLYGKKGDAGNSVSDPCSATLEQAASLKPLMKGEIAALQPVSKPLAFPSLGFESDQGTLTLAGFSGRVVLLISGPHGVCLVGRKCRRLIGCNISAAGLISR